MARSPGRRRSELPEILAAILETQGAKVSRDGMVWEASLTPELSTALGTESIRLVAAPAGRAARGAEMDAGMTERILLLGRTRGQTAMQVARVPWPKTGPAAARIWVRLDWRVRYGSDEIPEELFTQELPLTPALGLRAPKEGMLRAPTTEEAETLPKPSPQQLTATWDRALKLLESRMRRRLKPHEDRARRELHREMRTLSSHYRSLIAEERAGRARHSEDREAGRMLQLKEDWERKLAGVIRQRAFDTEASLVAAALVYALPDGGGPHRLTGATERSKLIG